MNSQSIIDNRSSRAAATPLVRLGANHSYRFDGDHVRLSAMFTVLDDDAHARAWALQLWACPQAPASAADLLSGHLIAESPLPPIGEIADDTHGFEVSSFACAPATAGDHAMVLVLAAAHNGRFDDAQDLAVYPAREHFLQPRMRGNASYRIESNRVQIAVGHIENPRNADNVSGTLALELWALSAPYAGGSFEGVSLAATTLGSVSGQSELTSSEFNLPFTPPSAGTWHFTLMLREWTAAGFVTRDFVSFTPAVTCAPTPTPGPVANTVLETAPTAVTSAPAVVASAAPVATTTATPVTTAPVVPVATSPVVSPVATPIPPLVAALATRPVSGAGGTIEAQKKPSGQGSKTVSTHSAAPQAVNSKESTAKTAAGTAKVAPGATQTVSKAAASPATPSPAIATKMAEPKKKSSGQAPKTVSFNPGIVEKQTAKKLPLKSRKA